MDQKDINKIDRFTDRIPPHLADHWGEIIDIINSDSNIAQLELDNFELNCKLRDNIKYLLIMDIWIDEGKINTKTGFKNMIHFIKSKVRND